MYTSVISLKMKPGTKEDILSQVNGMTDELRALDCKQFRVIEQENDSYIALALYDNKEIWQAASGKAAELLGQLAPYAAETPVRQGGDVIVSIDL